MKLRSSDLSLTLRMDLYLRHTRGADWNHLHWQWRQRWGTKQPSFHEMSLSIQSKHYVFCRWPLWNEQVFQSTQQRHTTCPSPNLCRTQPSSSLSAWMSHCSHISIKAGGLWETDLKKNNQSQSSRGWNINLRVHKRINKVENMKTKVFCYKNSVSFFRLFSSLLYELKNSLPSSRF